LLISDPLFYAVAIPAILLVGISKGGFGGGVGLIGTPMVTLVTTPTRAAAILLPILCAMDIVGAPLPVGCKMWNHVRHAGTREQDGGVP
jgi:uncharacterized membrane protein YfcA